MKEVLSKQLAESSKTTIDHETVASMNYMDAAITENLRMYPPVTR